MSPRSQAFTVTLFGNVISRARSTSYHSFTQYDDTDAKHKSHAFLDSLMLFGMGYSWGGFRSLAMEIELENRRVLKTLYKGALLRLQIGLEDVDDLICDLDQALRRAS
nr:PLP-dependent transferase [Rhizobium sp. 007]